MTLRIRAELTDMEDAGDHTRLLQAWLEKLQTTDDTSFEKVRRSVITHASQRLEKLVRKMLRNYPRLRRWEQTDDVFQNALLRLHQSLSTIRPDSVRQFYGLAATQIRRELIDLTRHHFGPEGAAANHHTDGGGVSPSSGSTIDKQVDFSGEPTSLSEWTEFHQAAERLPDAEREVFDLYWYEGLDQKTIASLLNVTERTIKNRWRSAKILLRSLLTDGDH